jgi:hypothetical protein
MKRRAILVGLASLMALGAGQPSYTGTWRLGGDPEKRGARLVTKHNAGEVEFQLECWRGAPSYNSGYIAGRVTLVRDKGTFRSADESGTCELTFVFSDNKVVIEHVDGALECGFGGAVYANGQYRRTSRQVPRFSDGDHRER